MEEICVAVIAAHPDDEILGCGGTVARLVADGALVHTLILGTGADARGGDQSAAVATLQEASLKAGQILGTTDPWLYNLPDNKFDTVPLLDIVQTVEQWLEHFSPRPSRVLTHFHSCLNIDHRLTAQAVVTATRPMADQPVTEVLMFETPSATEWAFFAPQPFVPNVFYGLDGAQMDKKYAALECYASELREYPHPRSLRAIAGRARHWGAIVGRDYAEAFMLFRGVR